MISPASSEDYAVASGLCFYIDKAKSRRSPEGRSRMERVRGIEPLSSGWKPEVIAIIRHPRDAKYKQIPTILKGSCALVQFFCNDSPQFRIRRLLPWIAGKNSSDDKKNGYRIVFFCKCVYGVLRTRWFMAAKPIRVEMTKRPMIRGECFLIHTDYCHRNGCRESVKSSQCFARDGSHGV